MTWCTWTFYLNYLERELETIKNDLDREVLDMLDQTIEMKSESILREHARKEDEIKRKNNKLYFGEKSDIY